MRLLILAEYLELVDLNASGPRRGTLEYVLRPEGSDALIRRRELDRTRDSFQGGGRQGLVHVVLCGRGSVQHDNTRR